MSTTTAPPGHPPSDASGNPALSDKVVSTYFVEEAGVSRMTVGGTTIKTFVFLLFVVAGGVWGWSSATQPVAEDAGAGYGNVTVTIPGGFWLVSIGALVVGIIVSVNPRLAPVLGPVYAVMQGYLLGAISAAFNAQTEGIVGAAILATVCVFAVALFLYVTRIVRPTQKMAFVVTAALGGLALIYLFVWVLSIFNWSWLYSEEFRTIGIVVLGISVILAALTLMMDFAMIEGLTESGAPKYLEWYCAFALMVTLIWLYITLLRLLALLARNR